MLNEMSHLPEALLDAKAEELLQMIKSGDADGEGLYPVTYYVNPGLQMLADPPFLQQWDARYPELSYARK